MKRDGLLALCLLLAALTFAACRAYLPTNRYLQLRSAPTAGSTADARHKFDHDKHNDPLAKANVTCVDCHRYDQVIETADEDLAKTLSTHGLHPGGAACHTCHGEGDGRMASAPQACTTCHENLKPLLPDDHTIAWTKVHASVASANTVTCENCHRSSFCIDCHERRDSIQTRVHDRNFRSTHGIAVRANPMECGSCHRQDFCSNCHQQGRGAFP